MSAGVLRVALGEYDTGWHDPALSLTRATALVAEVAGAGADLVVLPEMCTTGFTMESAVHSEPPGGRSIAALAAIARHHRVYLIAGVATRASSHDRSACYNSALVFGPQGDIIADYHKQRLFAYAGEAESYVPGATAVVVDINGVKVAPFICFDLRFPELFRPLAPTTDLIVVIANWPDGRRAHWNVLTQARAIENQCYVVAVNRTGHGGGLHYDGGSVAYTPSGELLTPDGYSGAPSIAEIDRAEVTRVRSEYPFVADQRGGS